MKKVFPNSSIKKEIIGEIIGFDRVKNSEACEFVSSITGDNSREVVSFGTEAGLFQEIGISTVVCGPGSIEQAHKIDEFIKLDELKKCLVFLEGVKANSVFKNIPSSLTTGLVSQFTKHLSAITLCAIPPKIPPI